MQPRALVTGAGVRLGRAMAVYLAQRGFDIAVHYSTSDQGAEETVNHIKTLGRNAIKVQADLLDLDQCEGLVAAASKALGGPLTCLVNNASIFEHDTLKTATRESWDRHMISNFRAPFILTQSFAAQVPDVDSASSEGSQIMIVNMVDQRVKKAHSRVHDVFFG